MLTFEPIHPDFGAKVAGLDLSRPLDATAVAELHEAVDTYSLLHFPGQQMSDEAQLALTCSLGEPEPNHVVFGKTGKVEYFGTIGNVMTREE